MPGRWNQCRVKYGMGKSNEPIGELGKILARRNRAEVKQWRGMCGRREPHRGVSRAPNNAGEAKPSGTHNEAKPSLDSRET